MTVQSIANKEYGDLVMVKVPRILKNDTPFRNGKTFSGKFRREVLFAVIAEADAKELYKSLHEKFSKDEEILLTDSVQQFIIANSDKPFKL